MSDKTRAGLNNQKRAVCVLVADLEEADILTTGSVYGNLPDNVLVMSAGVLVTTASGTASSTLDITINGTVVANEVDVDDTGFKAGTITEDARYFATGGEVVVRAGAVTPAAGTLVGQLVIEYIELNTVTGAYVG